MADQVPVHIATEEFVTRQKCVYELLWHVDQATTVNPELYEVGSKWDIRSNTKCYDNETVVHDFLDKYHCGMLPRGEIFSVFYPKILDEAITLFRLLHSATNFESFYKTAAWARVHVNEGLFIYAFSVAVVHRPDTKYIKLPSPQEINPYFFFNSEIMRKAHLIKMKHLPGSQKSYVILANNTAWCDRLHDNPERKLSYFVEDVGLNAYYHTLSLEFPYWMSSNEFNLVKGYRGEQYYYCLKLLMARYNLERLSNGLKEIEDIEWNEPATTEYHPFMSYENGVHFPHRHCGSAIPSNKYEHLREMNNSEARILAVIDSGYYVNVEGKLESIYSTNGIDILGNIIEGNADSVNDKFYGSIDAVGRNILGFSPHPISEYRVLPSALQHFSTSMRDPAFYRLCGRILSYFHRYKCNVELYTPEELGLLSGLKIESVLVDKLETYFDYFDTILNNAVAVRDNDDASSFVVKARQYRLNHKPFTYTVNIDAKEDTEAVVRIFLGSKYNASNEELDITENYANFYEFDIWRVNLTAGKNEIKRDSHEARFVVPDDEDTNAVYDKVKIATMKREPLTYSENVYGFPERLLVPKGRKEGMPLQVFVHVVPFNKGRVFETDSLLWGKAVLDGRPMGFPLDRPMKRTNFTLPNMYFEDVVVFHNETGEINVAV